MKNKKLEKIKLKTFGNIALVILWICLIFIFFKGTISIAKPVEIDIHDIENQAQKENSKKSLQSRAVAFGENFIREYMTYLGDEEEYAQRLKKFTKDDLIIENSRIFSTTYVNSITNKWIDNNVILVDCLVKGSYQKREKILQNPDILKNEETYYVRTAVNIIDNKFIISDYPTFISSPTKANQDNNVTQKEELDDEKKKNGIKKVVKSFLKSYYDGQNTELKYFLENMSVSETKKSFEFNDLKDFSVYMESKNTFYVKTSYYVNKGEDKFLQSMEFKLKIKDSKFIILEYNTKI